MPIEIILLCYVAIAAVTVCAMKPLLSSMIIFASYGIVMSIIWILLAAPDLAITEAAVGTGILGVLLFVVIKRIRVMEMEEEEIRKKMLESNQQTERAASKNNFFLNTISIIVCLCLTGILLVTVIYLPPFGNPANPTNNEVFQKYIEEGIQDTGAINVVASMILDYRAFDTFGEACVLFVAVCAVMILLRHKGPLDAFDSHLYEMNEPRQNVILKTTSFLLVAMIMVFGCYIILNGHLSPGGGFSGGAILGASLVLYSSAFGTTRASAFINFRVYCRIVPACLLFYAFAKGYSFYTGANHIPSIVPLGIPGNLLSGGLILPLNIAVGIIVACTVYVIFTLFSTGEFK